MTGKTTSTIDGQTYQDETQDQFVSRLEAEDTTATLKKVGVDITAYTHQFIDDADKYSAAVKDVASTLA